MKNLFVFFFLIAALSGSAQSYDLEQKAHFYGAELGFNQYTDPSVASGYQDLSLDTWKSMYFKLNVLGIHGVLLERPNKDMYDAKKLFVLLGVGLKWNNYRFNPNVRLVNGPSTLEVYRDSLQNNTKSKLTIFWLNIPLLLEYQFDRNWFITTGFEFGFRINSHAKYVYLVDGDKKKDKDWNAFGLNGFKADVVFGIGFGRISLNAVYSLVPLFKDGYGPVIHPYSINLMYSLGIR